MRLAILSNLYPPRFIGGYELAAARVVGELRRRGHEVRVLTAPWYRLQGPDGFPRVEQPLAVRCAIVSVGPCVHGSLVQLARRSPAAWAEALVAAQLARRTYLAALRAFRPDAIWAFSPACILAPVLEDLEDFARRAGVPFNGYLSDTWLADWPAGSLVRVELWDKLAGKLPALRGVVGWLERACGYRTGYAPRFDRLAFCSRYIERANEPGILGTPERRVVSHAAPEVAETVPAKRFVHPEPLGLVYVGQIQPHKGLEVLIAALTRTRRPHRLTVIGDDGTGYAAACKEEAARLGVADRIVWTGKLAAEAVAARAVASGEVLVLPSVWDEPFSLVVLEGMALGMVVLASDTGGTAEAFTDGMGGFLFPRGDAGALAALLDRVEADRRLAAAVAGRARAAAVREHSLGRMVDRLLDEPGALRRVA